MNHYDLVGLGIGPFHLSLAAFLSKNNDIKSLFIDQKDLFQWHPELLFNDADMQTSYMKDLVTPVDPTNPFSFMNYLVQHGLFYAFMNTGRKTISRTEFDHYCKWASHGLENKLKFSSHIEEVNFNEDHFIITTDKDSYTSKNISIATGMTPRIPEVTKQFLGKNVFHAKSGYLQNLDLKEKRVLIVGGGQTGVEIFRNSILGKWGRVQSVKLISRRNNLEPLDESPFTNEFFTPSYVDQFFKLEQESKDPIVTSQKLASDGNTPQYLDKLYNDLYQLKFVSKDDLDYKILPSRDFVNLTKTDRGYCAEIKNKFMKSTELFEADIIILCTGFTSSLPSFLNPIFPLLNFDVDNRIKIGRNFNVEWKGPDKNKIFALNFSRHRHGIAEPQTSLMAWRSATIINDLCESEVYKISNSAPTFIHYGHVE